MTYLNLSNTLISAPKRPHRQRRSDPHPSHDYCRVFRAVGNTSLNCRPGDTEKLRKSTPVTPKKTEWIACVGRHISGSRPDIGRAACQKSMRLQCHSALAFRALEGAMQAKSTRSWVHRIVFARGRSGSAALTASTLALRTARAPARRLRGIIKRRNSASTLRPDIPPQRLGT